MPHDKTGAIYAYNDPNWADSALKRCTRFNSGYNWRCAFCCNYSICSTLRQEEREKQLKEREEELKSLRELNAKIFESEAIANSVRLSNSPGMIWFDTERSTTTYDMYRSGTWQVVNSDNGYTTIRYAHDPEA
jgi:hypothetical protein